MVFGGGGVLLITVISIYLPFVCICHFLCNNIVLGVRQRIFMQADAAGVGHSCVIHDLSKII